MANAVETVNITNTLNYEPKIMGKIIEPPIESNAWNFPMFDYNKIRSLNTAQNIRWVTNIQTCLSLIAYLKNNFMKFDNEKNDEGLYLNLAEICKEVNDFEPICEYYLLLLWQDGTMFSNLDLNIKTEISRKTLDKGIEKTKEITKTNSRDIGEGYRRVNIKSICEYIMELMEKFEEEFQI